MPPPPAVQKYVRREIIKKLILFIWLQRGYPHIIKDEPDGAVCQSSVAPNPLAPVTRTRGPGLNNSRHNKADRDRRDDPTLRQITHPHRAY